MVMSLRPPFFWRTLYVDGLRPAQNVEFRINKGALGLSKDVTHYVLEYQSPAIAAHATRSFSELQRDLQVPVMPPTMADICRVIEIAYTLKVRVCTSVTGLPPDLCGGGVA